MTNLIKIERAKINISQEHLAEKVGISKTTIHNIENDYVDPRLITSMKIARFFGVGVQDIFEL